jgi:hypothetical protein
MLYSCHRSTQKADKLEELTASQQLLMSYGWTLKRHQGGELDKAYGVTPVYGIQDNYFDIVIGQGCNVALKIMDATTDKCIRYVYVPENEMVTVSEIPQGLYYLKLAYGKDWMELHSDSIILGKFTKGAFYERSTNTYDFGKKNSQTVMNYRLEINVVDDEAENNFYTEQISEEEFAKN